MLTSTTDFHYYIYTYLARIVILLSHHYDTIFVMHIMTNIRSTCIGVNSTKATELVHAIVAQNTCL